MPPNPFNVSDSTSASQLPSDAVVETRLSLAQVQFAQVVGRLLAERWYRRHRQPDERSRQLPASQASRDAVGSDENI